MRDIRDNIKKRDWMIDLRKMKDRDLEKMYNESNLTISKFRAGVKVGQDMGKLQRNYQYALKMRARVLTVMNQRRHKRMMLNGNS